MSTAYYQPYWDQTDELEHHGILGQKWGVRRYQNKDGTLTTLGKKRISAWKLKSGIYSRDDAEDISFPKGTKLYRVAYDGQDPDSNMYVSRSKMDRNFYRLSYQDSIMGVGKDPRTIKESIYTTTEELKIPSFNKRKEAFEELAKDKTLRKAMMEDMATGFVKRSALVKVSSIKEAKDMLKSNSSLSDESKKILKAAITGSSKYAKDRISEIDGSDKIISARTMSQMIGSSPKVRDAYVKILKKQGYNATVDDYGRKGLWGTAGETSEALMIFNPSVSSIKKSTKFVPIYKTENEIRNKQLTDLKYDAKILKNPYSAEQIKIYNNLMKKRELATVASAIVPVIPGLMYSNAATKANVKINALEQEKRKNWK